MADGKQSTTLESKTLGFIDPRFQGAFTPDQLKVLNAVVEPLVAEIESLQGRVDSLEGQQQSKHPRIG